MRLLPLLTLAVLALTLTTPAADAGPIRDRLAARRGSCSSCGQQPRGLAFRPQEAVAAVAAQVSAGLRPVASSCPGGVCPVPAARTFR